MFSQENSTFVRHINMNVEKDGPSEQSLAMTTFLQDGVNNLLTMMKSRRRNCPKIMSSLSESYQKDWMSYCKVSVCSREKSRLSTLDSQQVTFMIFKKKIWSKEEKTKSKSKYVSSVSISCSSTRREGVTEGWRDPRIRRRFFMNSHREERTSSTR